MSEDFLTSAWADSHKQFSDQIGTAISRALETVRVSMARLNRYEFDAPWKRQATHRRPA